METWLLPPPTMPDGKGYCNEQVAAQYVEPRPSSKLPDLLGTLGTMRKRFHALNYGTDAASGSAPVTGGSGSGGGVARSTPSSGSRRRA